MIPLAEAPELDIFSAEFQADPAPIIRELRGVSPVIRTPIGAMVIGREEVRTLFADSRVNSALTDLMLIQGITEGPIYDRISTSILAIDGPEHTRLRKLVSRAFTPRAVERVRPVMAKLADELIDGFAATGRCEFVADFAASYPVQVICELLGVPRADHADFAAWSDDLTYALSLEVNNHATEILNGFRGMDGYIESLIAERRANPTDDLVSDLIAVEEEGDRLNHDELVGMIIGLLFAGYDTTRSQLGNSLFTFALNPDQWELLGSDPSLAFAATDECLRMMASIGGTIRKATTDVELGGVMIPTGTMIMLSMSSANKDPEAFTDPDRFDITVERDGIFSFGGGAHYCLGATLARVEMAEALPRLAARMPDLELDGDPVFRNLTLGIFGPNELRLKFTPTSG